MTRSGDTRVCVDLIVTLSLQEADSMRTLDAVCFEIVHTGGNRTGDREGCKYVTEVRMVLCVI